MVTLSRTSGDLELRILSPSMPTCAVHHCPPSSLPQILGQWPTAACRWSGTRELEPCSADPVHQGVAEPLSLEEQDSGACG